MVGFSLYLQGSRDSLSYFVCFDVGLKFEKIALGAQDTKDKVANFLTLSTIDMSFKLEHCSLQERSSTTALMVTSKNPAFLLSTLSLGS